VQNVKFLVYRLIFALMVLALLTASQCSPPLDATPNPWYVVKTRFNSNTPNTNPGDARTTIFFSSGPIWQERYPDQRYFAPGWMNDLVVKISLCLSG